MSFEWLRKIFFSDNVCDRCGDFFDPVLEERICSECTKEKDCKPWDGD